MTRRTMMKRDVVKRIARRRADRRAWFCSRRFLAPSPLFRGGGVGAGGVGGGGVRRQQRKQRCSERGARAAKEAARVSVWVPSHLPWRRAVSSLLL
jgi:hypothetical protein